MSQAALQIIDLPAHQQADVYFEANLKGKVYVKIVSQGEESCCDFWWIEWPFGRVEQQGRHCGFAAFDLPGGLTVSAKLRAGNGTGHIKLGVSASESVARDSTIHF